VPTTKYLLLTDLFKQCDSNNPRITACSLRNVHCTSRVLG